MGKVNIIIERKDISSSELEKLCHKIFDEEDELPPWTDVFIVPIDEE